MKHKIETLTAFDLAKLLDQNKLDPVDIIYYLLDKYKKSNYNTKLSFSRVLSNYALKEAEASRKRQLTGKRKSFLDGIPIVWKDMIDISYAPAYAGSNALKILRKKDKVKSAKVFLRARNSGLISLAKSSTVELAFGGIGINNSCPLPTNLMIPGNVAAGGSSTGSATAIFSGLAPIGIGTDTAGSVRIPAAWHGLVALKPSLGMISMNGVIPLSKSNDTLGVISKCVKDARLIFQILSEKKYNFSSNQSN